MIAVSFRPVGLPQAAGAPIVKLVLEISKKIFPTASTFIRLVVPVVFGTFITSVTSFAVAAANTVGNVCPPSVDNKIFTLWQFTDPPFVPFTLHVTVAVDPAFQVIFELGEVTAKGPAVFVTVTTASVNAVWPIVDPGTYGLLSLTVTLKLSVLETELNASIFAPLSPPGKGPVTLRPARIVDNLGNNRVPDTVGENDSQFGPVVFVGDATLPDPDVDELSFCSQQ